MHRLAPRRLLVASVVALLACGPSAPASVVHAEPQPAAPSPSPAAVDPAEPQPAAPSPSPADPSPPLSPAVAEAPSVDRARACAAVDIGLDLRVLPNDAGLDGIDMFVRGEAEDLRRATKAPPPPEVFVQPGIGSLHARFAAADGAAAIARCKGAVAAYLEHAPRLPLLMTPAARVTEACRRCQ